MKRDFNLKPISFKEFNNISSLLGLPKYRLKRYFEKSTGRRWERSFQKILETAVYDGGIEQIRDRIKEEAELVAVCLRYEGDLHPKAAEERTLFSGERHYQDLLEKEKDFDRLIINCVSERNLRDYLSKRSKKFKDTFSFVKENGVWVLRRININRANFSAYTLVGPNNRDDEIMGPRTFTVCGVYHQ